MVCWLLAFFPTTALTAAPHGQEHGRERTYSNRLSPGDGIDAPEGSSGARCTRRGGVERRGRLRWVEIAWRAATLFSISSCSLSFSRVEHGEGREPFGRPGERGGRKRGCLDLARFAIWPGSLAGRRHSGAQGRRQTFRRRTPRSGRIPGLLAARLCQCRSARDIVGSTRSTGRRSRSPSGLAGRRGVASNAGARTIVRSSTLATAAGGMRGGRVAQRPRSGADEARRAHRR